jgi:hypothetical protein
MANTSWRYSASSGVCAARSRGFASLGRYPLICMPAHQTKQNEPNALSLSFAPLSHPPERAGRCSTRYTRRGTVLGDSSRRRRPRRGDGIVRKLDRHIATLERDAARMRAIDDDLDDLRWIRPSFHADGPLVELDWFVGDGGGSTLTTGATISEAVDAYLAALTPSRETSE